MPTPFSEITPEEIIPLAVATRSSARRPACSTGREPINLSSVIAAASTKPPAATPSSATTPELPTPTALETHSSAAQPAFRPPGHHPRPFTIHSSGCRLDRRDDHKKLRGAYHALCIQYAHLSA